MIHDGDLVQLTPASGATDLLGHTFTAQRRYHNDTGTVEGKWWRLSDSGLQVRGDVGGTALIGGEESHVLGRDLFAADELCVVHPWRRLAAAYPETFVVRTQDFTDPALWLPSSEDEDLSGIRMQAEGEGVWLSLAGTLDDAGALRWDSGDGPHPRWAVTQRLAALTRTEGWHADLWRCGTGMRVRIEYPFTVTTESGWPAEGVGMAGGWGETDALAFARAVFMVLEEREAPPRLHWRDQVQREQA